MFAEWREDDINDPKQKNSSVTRPALNNAHFHFAVLNCTIKLKLRRTGSLLKVQTSRNAHLQVDVYKLFSVESPTDQEFNSYWEYKVPTKRPRRQIIEPSAEWYG